MRVLVTGGAGFIGSHAVRRFLSMGWDVTVADDLRHGLRENVPDEAGFCCIDINSPALQEVLGRSPFDQIVHLAAQTRVDTSMEKPLEDAADNVMGTLNILELARKCHVRRIIFASSAAVYGNPPETALPLKESEPAAPLSFYGMSKATAERYIQLYHENFGLEYAILRFANVYGERINIDDEGGVVNVFSRRAAAGEPITVYGDGSQSRDYIYVGDIVNGIVAAMEAEAIHDAYNLSTGREEPLHKIINTLSKLAGKKLNPIYEAPRNGDICRSVLCREKAGKELGWQPYMTLENGLARMYRYFLSQQTPGGGSN